MALVRDGSCLLGRRKMTPHRKFFCWNLGATFSSVLHMEQIYSLLQNRGVEWTEVHWTALYICSGLCNSVCFSARLSRGNHIFTFLPNTSFLTFGELQSTGSVQVVQWTDGAPAWEVYSKIVHPPCGPSAICGKNKSLICSCLTGFVPKETGQVVV
ncbi:hypothetical protein FXO37_29797 [Capsicum annuum]|nr:hypothetical protein FXO37_29797 [Capsicum annuum]